QVLPTIPTRRSSDLIEVYKTIVIVPVRPGNGLTHCHRFNGALLSQLIFEGHNLATDPLRILEQFCPGLDRHHVITFEFQILALHVLHLAPYYHRTHDQEHRGRELNYDQPLTKVAARLVPLNSATDGRHRPQARKHERRPET